MLWDNLWDNNAIMKNKTKNYYFQELCESKTK
jgi:hypothetical protein